MVRERDWVPARLPFWVVSYCVDEAKKRFKAGRRYDQELSDLGFKELGCCGVEYLGVAGEFVVAELLGVPYDDSSRPDDKVDTHLGGRRIDVKTTHYRTGGLPRFEAEIGVLCHVEPGKWDIVHVIGWFPRSEFEKEAVEVISGFYVVKQDKLRPFVELLQKYRKKCPCEEYQMSVRLRHSADRAKLKSLMSDGKLTEQDMDRLFCEARTDDIIKDFAILFTQVKYACLKVHQSGKYQADRDGIVRIRADEQSGLHPLLPDILAGMAERVNSVHTIFFPRTEICYVIDLAEYLNT